MKTEIANHGPRFYTITMGSNRGHKTATGQALTAPDVICLPFREESDPEGVNLDPVDLLSVLHSLLEDTPAAEHLEAAVEALNGSAEEVKKPVGTTVPRLGGKPAKGKPGPKPKGKAPVTETPDQEAA